MPRIDELWYDLELRSKDFTEGLKESEAAAQRFTKFMKDHPLAVTAALATGFILLGAKAVEMADKVDAAIRKIGASLPEAAQKMDLVRNAIIQLSNENGIAQEKIADYMRQVAEGGVSSAEALVTQTRAVALAAQASSLEFTTVIDGLDAALDTFGLKAEDSEAALARLYATAQGRAPLQDMLTALQRLAPVVQDAGLSFNEATAALGVLYERGYNARNAVAELQQLFNDRGTPAIRELAKQAHIAADGLSIMQKQAESMAGTLEFNANILRERYNNALIELGDIIMPHVVEVTEGWVHLLDGSISRLGRQKDAFNLAQLGQYADKLDRGSQAWLTLGHSGQNVIDQLNKGTLDLSTMSVEQLQGLSRGLYTWMQTLGDGVTAEWRASAEQALAAIQQAVMAAPGGPGRGYTGPRRPGQRAGGSGLDTRVTGTGGSKALHDAEAAAKALETFRQGVEDLFDDATVSLVDNAERAIQRFIASAKEAGLSSGETAAAVALMREQMASLGDLQTADTFLASFDDTLVHVDGMNQQLNETRRILGLLEVQANKLPEDSAKRAEIEQRINALKEKERGITNRLWGEQEHVTETTTATETATVKWQDRVSAVASEVSNVARGVIGIAQAFGIADAKATALLNNVVSIADAIPGALAGSPTAIFSLVGNIGGLLGGLFGGGPSARDLEDQRIRKENNARLAELAKVMGEFYENITGQTYARAAQVVSGLLGIHNPIAAFGGSGSINSLFTDKKAVDRALKGQGSSLAELKDLADAFGITLNLNSGVDKFIESLHQLDDAIKKTELTKWVDTFAGRMDALNARFRIFGITDPLEQLTAIVGELNKVPHTGAGGQTIDTSSPAFRRILQGLDLQTAEGRATLQQRIRDLFNQLDAGLLNPADLGGLTPQQFIDQLTSLADLLNQISAGDGTTAGSGNKAAGINRTISEASALQQISLMISMDASLRYIAGAVAAWWQGTGGGPIGAAPLQLGPLPAPVLGTDQARGGGIYIDTLMVSVEGSGVGSIEDAGSAAARGFLTELDAQLGVKVRLRKLASGNIVS